MNTVSTSESTQGILDKNDEASKAKNTDSIKHHARSMM